MLNTVGGIPDCACPAQQWCHCECKCRIAANQTQTRERSPSCGRCLYLGSHALCFAQIRITEAVNLRPVAGRRYHACSCQNSRPWPRRCAEAAQALLSCLHFAQTPSPE